MINTVLRLFSCYFMYSLMDMLPACNKHGRLSFRLNQSPKNENDLSVFPSQKPCSQTRCCPDCNYDYCSHGDVSTVIYCSFSVLGVFQCFDFISLINVHTFQRESATKCKSENTEHRYWHKNDLDINI